MKKILSILLINIFLSLVISCGGCGDERQNTTPQSQNPAPHEITGTAYYVSTSGSDSNNGCCDPANGVTDCQDCSGTDGPWQTIAKVNSVSFEPGEGILFKRGDTWRDPVTTLMVSSSGTSDAWITYGSYGTGDRPKLYSSQNVESWTHVSGNIWVSDSQTVDPGDRWYTGAAWFVNIDGSVEWGSEKSISAGDYANLQSDFDWGWIQGSGSLVYPQLGGWSAPLGYIYTYSSVDPNTVYSSFEASANQYAMSLNNKEFIIIEDLDIRYAQSRGIGDELSMRYTQGLIIRNNEIAYMGIKGSAAAYGIAVWSSDAIIANNTIHDCGRRSISYNVNDGSTIITNPTDGMLVEYVTIENNIMFDGYHTTGWDISGAAAVKKTFRNFVIRNNLLYSTAKLGTDGISDPTCGYINADDEESDFHDFEVYDNIIVNSMGDGMQVSGVNNISVHNNIYYGMNDDFAGYFPLRFYGSSNVAFHNNIIVQVLGGYQSNTLIRSIASSTSPSATFVSLDNNVYYHLIGSGAIYTFASSGGSQYYSSSDFSTFKTNTGFETNGYYDDPLFVDPDYFDFSFQSSSPARNAGLFIEGYHCATSGAHPGENCKEWYGTAPDIGVIEFVE